MCCTALIKAVSDRCHRIMMLGCRGGGMGGGGSSSGGGSGGWGRKDHPHGSLCNNDSNVNDGAATSINSGLLQELQRRRRRTRPPGRRSGSPRGFPAQNQRRADARQTHDNTLATHQIARCTSPCIFCSTFLLLRSADAAGFARPSAI